MPNTREKLIKIVKDTNTELERRHYMVVSIADRIIASGFIEELQNEGYDMGVDSALHNHFGLSWEDAARLRKEIKRLQEAARWIPVSKRLPNKEEYTAKAEDGTEYYVRLLIAYKTDVVEYEIGYYDGYKWMTEMPIRLIKDVVAWMPFPNLPQPPKEGEYAIT